MHIPDDHAHCVHVFTTPGLAEPVAFTLGVYVDSAPATAVQVANRVFDCAKLEIMPEVANEWTLQKVVAYYRQGADLFIGESTVAPVAGTQGTGSCSPAVAHLVRKNTGLAGRKYRGRAFIPGIRETAVDAAGVVLAAVVTQFNTALNDWRVKLEDDGIVGFATRPRILHTSASEPPTPITSFTLDTRVGTQRRRQR